MNSIDPIYLLVSWTPVAVAALALLLLFVAIAGLLLYIHRVAFGEWLTARWVEQSSAHARTIALYTTAFYIGSRLHIPEITPVSLNLCLIGWARAAWKFIKPEGTPPLIAGSVPTAASIVVCIGLAMSLSGCTFPSLPGDPSKDLPALGGALTSADAAARQSVASLAKFTIADLQAADADAVANADTAAHACYAALLPVVQAQAVAPPAAVGGISAFQRSRDIVKLVKGQGMISQACAALKQDVTGDVLGLGGLFGVP